MGLTYKKQKGKQYIYFKAGRTGTYYIGPRDSPANVKIENVEKSLQYLKSRITKDRKAYDTLLRLLPVELRAKYENVFD